MIPERNIMTLFARALIETPTIHQFIFHFDWRNAMLQSHFPVSRSNIHPFQQHPVWMFSKDILQRVLAVTPRNCGRCWDVPMWGLRRTAAVAFRWSLGRASAERIERMTRWRGCRAHWIPTTLSLRAQTQWDVFGTFGDQKISKDQAYHMVQESILFMILYMNIYEYSVFPSSSWIMGFTDRFFQFLTTELLPNVTTLSQ